MDLPFFYEPALAASAAEFPVSDDTAHHLSHVLRMRAGASCLLTDGMGLQIPVELVSVEKKQVLVRRGPIAAPLPSPVPLVVAVSLLKNTSRFEWMLEKCTEIGASRIVPLLCTRTERQHFRIDRMRQLVVAAMLQSQQVWLPEVPEPQTFSAFLGEPFAGKSYIAHCLPEPKDRLRSHPTAMPARILIGPEGDFTPQEITAALEKGFLPVGLGDTRLRTETAAIVAAAVLKEAMSAKA